MKFLKPAAHLLPTYVYVDITDTRICQKGETVMKKYRLSVIALVLLLLCACGLSEEERLERALADTGLTGSCAPTPPPPEAPEAALTPRQALFAPRVRLPLADCAGRIAACQIAPYPPGVPVIAPGERIEKKHLAYLREIGYNRDRTDIIAEGRDGEGGPGHEADHRHHQL